MCVCMCICISVKFHVKPPWDGEMKVCSNGPGLMTICTLICVKNLKKIFFSGTKRPMTLKLGMQHCVLEYYRLFR